MNQPRPVYPATTWIRIIIGIAIILCGIYCLVNANADKRIVALGIAAVLGGIGIGIPL